MSTTTATPSTKAARRGRRRRAPLTSTQLVYVVLGLIVVVSAILTLTKDRNFFSQGNLWTIFTAMTAGLSPSARNRIVAAIPAGRTGTAEEIADVVVAVAGASYMTGAVVPVDGGLMATFGGTG